MAEDWLSFDDVLKTLQLQEAELRSFIAQNKLRAYRDENTLKFRRGDVEKLRKQRETEPTMVLRPGEQAPKPQAQPAAPVAEEPAGLLGEEDWSETADTIIGGDTGTAGADNVEIGPELGGAAAKREPSTKVPTIELTTPDTGTEDTDVPTLELGDIAGASDTGSETEVPTMVLGLDEYDDTQVATEDVATEEVSLEPGDLAAVEPATEADRGLEVQPEEEQAAEAQAGRITASSSLGTGEPLAVRELPSTLYTVVCASTAFVLLIPGGVFFYCLVGKHVPDWGPLRDIIKTFWNWFNLTSPPSWQ